jgi:uncharacterized protein involved in exopolysaccharide biosynthesis
MVSPSHQPSHVSIARVFRRYFLQASVVLVLCLIAAAAYTAVSPVNYGSEAKIFVRLGRESVELDPTATTGQTVSVQDSRENEINSVFETLTSRAILEGVVDELGPDVILDSAPRASQADNDASDASLVTNVANARDNSLGEKQPSPTMLQKLNPLTSYSRRDDAIRKLSKKLSVANAKKSNIITIFCEGQTPEVAQKIVERVIELARDAHTRVNRIDGSLGFFTAQTDAERTNLRDLESKLCDLKTQSGVASLEQQREIQLKQIGSLEDELYATDRSLEAAEAETQSIRQRLKVQPATVVTAETTGMADSASARMREQLYALQIRQQELASKMTDENPQLIQVRAQISQAQATLDHEKSAPEVTKGENKTYKDLEMAMYHSETDVESFRAKQRLLTQQLTDARVALKATNEVERQLGSLELDLDVSRQKYRRYTENLEQARIDQALASERISNINVLQPPTLSYTPVGPRTMINLIFGMGLGLIGAVTVVALGEQRRREQLAIGAMPFHRATLVNGSNGVSGNANPAFAGSSQSTDRALFEMGFSEVRKESDSDEATNHHEPAADPNTATGNNGRFPANHKHEN